MNIPLAHYTTRRSRLGFHYFQDTFHFREKDLQEWLPELANLGTSWLVLQFSVERAIPEHFIKSLIQAGIEPLIQFNFSLASPPEPGEIQTIFEVYAHWGIRSILLFNRPNSRASWNASGWAQQDLIERFLDRSLPLSNLALRCGLLPIFPALEPGGSYWDTSFLRIALDSLVRRKENDLIENLVLSAYAWTENHSLDWGFGGPEKWPGARPYSENPNQQDQRGFRVFDWYNSMCQAVLQKSCPIVLLQAGIAYDPGKSTKTHSSEAHSQINLNIAKLLLDEKINDPDSQNNLQPIPDFVVACNFWLLAAGTEGKYEEQAWYKSTGAKLPAVQTLTDWIKQKDFSNVGKKYDLPSLDTAARPIRHYLLLPAYEWGISDWHLDVIRPFIKKYHPTIGFSVKEAEMAARVTVVGNSQNIGEDTVTLLRSAGCIVDEIDGDGTSIATQLLQR